MEFAAVRACPVIDTDLKLVGIISDRDLIKASVIRSLWKTDMSADGERTLDVGRVMQSSISITNLQNKTARYPVSEAMVPQRRPSGG